MFLQYPLYYHPILKPGISGRKNDQILKCFSSDYANSPNREIVEMMGPIRKVQPFFEILLDNFQRVYNPTEYLSFEVSATSWSSSI